MKLIINKGFGKFRFSQEILKELRERIGHKIIKRDGSTYAIERFDPDDFRYNKDIIALVEKLGPQKSSDKNSLLKVIEIPDNIDFYIEDNHNVEVVHEKHRVWE